MLFIIASITAFLATTSGTAATPVAARDTSFYNIPAKYNLQTKVVDSSKVSTGTNKDGLYLVSYHTGAGLGAGGLAQEPAEQWYTYSGTNDQIYFTYNGSIAPWPLQVGYGAYQAWVPLSISVSGSTGFDQGFFFNETGLQYNQTNNGWLACDWWYSYPELFLLQYGYSADTYPSSCSKVELYPVALPGSY